MPDVKFSNQYPYTDFHELNLDWVIKEVKYWSTKVGKTIQSIVKTGTAGLVDTYTITYSDGSTSTYDVTNGNGIASVAKTGTVGLVDTYTITFQDGSTTTFEVHNGTASIDPTLTLSGYAADAKVVGDDFHDMVSFDSVIGLNKFNKNDPDTHNDWYITANGTTNNVGGSGYNYTHLMALEYGKTYTFATYASYGSARDHVFLYDSDGVFIEYIQCTLDAGYHATFTVTNPAWKNARCNIVTSQIPSFMFVESATYPNVYVPYQTYNQLTNKTLISQDQYDEIVNMRTENPLYGKKVALDGDSICYGYGYLGGYGKIIADRNAMTYYNGAVSGSKLVGDIVGRLSSLPSDADYYIYEGGVNDYASGTYNLGQIQNWGYAIDPTTVTGAVQYIFKYLYDNFPGKKYGFVFPHRIQQYGSAWDTTFKPALKEALKKWGIPFIDIEELEMPLNMSATYRALYTDNSDGWHPNEAGYKDIYCDKIEAWMKTL